MNMRSSSMSPYPFLLLIIIFQYQCLSSISSQENHLCPPEQSQALLQFKQDFRVSNADDDVSFRSKTTIMSWNRSTDCCAWFGVTCDGSSGDVIGLELSYSHLQGTLPSNSSLFKLSRLQRLNLAWNDLYFSSFPHEFVKLATSLTHLNLSNSGFLGNIPSEISLLSKLVSLDLSGNPLVLEPHIFELIIQNLTHLRELDLANIPISSVFPTNLSSSLTYLVLSGTQLHGVVNEEVFHLPDLQTLDLSENYGLQGNLGKVNIGRISNSSSPLRRMDLSSTSFSGAVPDWIGHLKYLSHLDLHNCQFSGSIPRSIGNLTQLSLLDLSNNSFSGEIMDATLSNLEQLTRLDFSSNNLEGRIPNTFIKLQHLTDLNFKNNKFSGLFPSSVANLTQLVLLDISFNSLTSLFYSNNVTGLQKLTSLDFKNNSLAGTIPSWIFTLPSLGYICLSANNLYGSIPSSSGRTGLQNLNNLDLSHNSLDGRLPSWLFTHPSLATLLLGSNRLSHIDELIQSTTNSSWLEYIDLSGNEIGGPFPMSILQELVYLSSLNLSSNALTSGFSGIDILLSSLESLNSLDLSYTPLSISPAATNSYNNTRLSKLFLASCKITQFPEFLGFLKNLQQLDLSNNQIHGRIPDWAAAAMSGDLMFIDLSHNLLTGVDQLPWTNLAYLNLQSNLIHGSFPPSICKLRSLNILDLSRNNLDGLIPECLGNLSSLTVIDLQMNSLHGAIPMSMFTNCDSLRDLRFYGNLLEGSVPRNLANCKGVEVLNLGNNHLNGSFPHWLDTLPMLQVLVLRSNRFSGPISSSSKTKHPFPKLRILDLSHNGFTGLLPSKYFENFKAMKNLNFSTMTLEYMTGEYGGLPGRTPLVYHHSVSLDLKGVEIELTRILTFFTAVDLSSNKFEGEIPNLIGSVNSLLMLNLSHNNLVGPIPSSMGNLSYLESLDLSWNQLTGRIPEQLTSLIFLQVLNLSQNHLVGRIPQGNQFHTFQNNSYIGNPALCGMPLSKNCQVHLETSPPRELQEDTSSGFTWKAVVLGYGCGTVVGLVVGYLMFLTGKPKWFNRLVKLEEERIVNRGKKRIYVSNRRR